MRLLGELDYSSLAGSAPDFARTLLAGAGGFASTFGCRGGLAPGTARGVGAGMRARARGRFSFRLAAWFPLRGCGRFTAAGRSPAGLIHLAAAGDGQRVRGDIFGDCGTGGDMARSPTFTG